MKNFFKTVTMAALLFCSAKGHAQMQALTARQMIDTALQNNPSIQTSSLQIQQQRILAGGYRDFGKTNISFQYGQSNSATWDSYFTIEQPIPNPSLFKNQKAYHNAVTKGSELNLAITQNELVYQVKTVYYQLSYLQALRKLLQTQDTVFSGFFKAADLRYRTGETNLLERTTAETQLKEIHNRIQQNEADILIARQQLESFTNVALPQNAAIDTLSKLGYLPQFLDSVHSLNPEALYAQQQINVAEKAIGVEKAKGKPDFSIGYFNQSIIGTQEINGQPKTFDAGHRFQGGFVGISIPIFRKSVSSRIEAAEKEKEIAQSQYQLFKINLKAQYQQACNEYLKDQENIRYYETSALANGDLILKQAQLAFREGDIGYVEYLQALRTYRDIHAEYLNAINELNQSIIRIQYLGGIVE